MKTKFVLLFVALSALVIPASAVSFSLSADGCTGGCGPGPFGTVDLLQNGASVDVTVTLFSNFNFVRTGGPHHAFNFNVSGGAVTISSLLTSDFSNGGTGGGASPYGTFGYNIDCTGCGNGGSSPKAGPITFTVSRVGGVLVSDFVTNADGYRFASDVINLTTRTTGNVGTPGGAIPEPATLGLVLTSLSGLWLLKRRKQIA